MNRVGDGTTALSSAANPVSVVEFTTAGVDAGNTILLPSFSSGGNNQGGFADSGTATSNGFMNRSGDKMFLSLMGIDAQLGTASVTGTSAAVANRNIANISSGGVVSVEARLTDSFTTNNARSAVSTNGDLLWIAGTGTAPTDGVRYVDASAGTPTTSTQIAAGNLRNTAIFGGVLFTSNTNSISSHNAPGVPPTTATAGTPLAFTTGGIASGSGAFFFFDRDGATSATNLNGLDTLYVIDGSAIEKYEWTGAGFTQRGSAVYSGTLFGLTAAVNGGNVDLYATNGLASNNALIKVVDNSGFGGTLTKVAADFTLLASAGANYGFRGVSFAPGIDPAGQLLINEVEADPGDQTNDSCQFVEIKGANPGGVIPANTWFLSVESDSSNPGRIHVAVNLGGQAVGSNGTLTLVNTFGTPCAGRTYGAGTTVVNYSSPTFIGGSNTLVGSESFVLLQTATALAPGQDRDVDDDGILDFPVTQYIDGVAFLVNPDEQVQYPSGLGGSEPVSPVIGTGFGDQPDALVRFPTSLTTFTGNSYYWSEVDAAPVSSNVMIAPFSPNFPTCGVLTPGDVNPSCAPPTPSVNLAVSANAGTEAGSTIVIVTAQATSAVSGAQTVDLAVTGTNITAGDYNLSGTVITIPDGLTSGQVTFTIVNDSIFEGTETAVLTISNPSAGMTLGTTLTQNVVITDNDVAGVTVTQSGGSTDVTEGGATDTYSVVLTSQPTANVVITISPDTQVTTLPTTLTFTDTDWNVAKVVTVTAVDDAINEGPHTGTIGQSSSSGDANYNITVASVLANITDNEAGQLLINEIEADPGDQTNDTCQYIEIKGAVPGGIVPANTWVVAVDADAGNPGVLNAAINISGKVVGANGTLTLINTLGGACPNRVYDPGTTIVNYNSTSRIGGANLTVGSESFIILETAAVLASGQDRDADDDGVLDFTVNNYIDGVSFLVNPDEYTPYPANSPVLGAPFTDVPDALVRFAGNTATFDAASYFWAEVASPPAESTVLVPTTSANFPSCGVLTPGAVNTVPGSCGPPTVPETAIDVHPSNPTNSTTATFEFSSTSSPVTFECQIDGGGFTACTTPKTYTGLTAGSHTFQVRAVNTAGPDPTPASFTWTVDDVSPVITYTPLSDTTSNSPVPLTVTVTDDVAVGAVTIFYSINGGAFASSNCTGTAPTFTCTVPGQVTGTAVAYYVSAADTAGNVVTNTNAAAPNFYSVGNAAIPAGTYTNMQVGGNSSLAGDVTVLENLDLNGILSGNNSLALVAFTVTIDCNATVTGAGPAAYVDGSTRKNFCTTGTFSFPVGQAGYTPVDVNITALTTNPSSLTVQSYDAVLSPFNPATSISRNWSLTETGNLTASLLFTYGSDATDVNGTESDYRLWKRDGANVITDVCGAPCVNTVTNQLGPVAGVTEFSRWTGSGPLAPTASNASISGRALTADGRGIRNAIVTVSGGNLVTPIQIATGSLGWYSFAGLATGQSYVVTVASKRFTFSTPSRVVSLTDNISDVDFMASPQE